jgi:hypothetical protein
MGAAVPSPVGELSGNILAWELQGGQGLVWLIRH